MSDASDGITLLFTGVTGRAVLAEQYAARLPDILARQSALLRGAIAERAGHVFKAADDTLCAAFGGAADALAAAVAGQRALLDASWESGPRPRVRIALHSGQAQERGGDYVGPALHRAAALLQAGHGDQILLSAAAQEGARPALPDGVTLRDLGEHRLEELSRPERVFQAVVPGLRADFPLLCTRDNRPSNVPVQTFGLIGRAEEVASARTLIRGPDVRLLSFVGPGGSGKTRLCLQVAAHLLDEFASGVFYVPLAPVRDAGRVVSAVAQALGVRETPGRALAGTLVEYLRPREMLLVLDNFEQVVAAAPRLGEWLAAAPWLKVLVTSRTPLRIPGEREFHVPSLAVPDLKRLPPPAALEGYSAIQMFVTRARAVKPDFRLTRENARAVAEVCWRLDGLPLALELAAARSATVSIEDMAAQLAGAPGRAALNLLQGGTSNLPARQQALRSTIEWSYALLAPAQQQLFARLSVFVSGFCAEAAEAVGAEGGAAVLPALAALVDQSLLQREPASERYAMLETIGEYALEQLEAGGGAADARARHARYYLGLAEASNAEITGAQQGAWLAQLEADHDNLRAALAWLLAAGDGESALRLASSLWRFWIMHGHLSEARQWLTEALARDPGTSPACRADALNGAGVVAWRQGDYAEATRLCEQSLALRRDLGDRIGLSSSLNNLGLITHEQGDYTRAKVYYAESLAISRELRYTWASANSLNNLGQVARGEGDYAQAQAYYAESLEAWRAHGYQGGIAMALSNLGYVASAQNDVEQAHAYFEESLGLRQALGDRLGMAECLAGLAGVLLAQGRVIRAARMCGAVQASLDAIDASLERLENAEYARNVEAARAALGETAFAAAWCEGQGLALEAAIAELR